MEGNSGSVRKSSSRVMNRKLHTPWRLARAWAFNYKGIEELDETLIEQLPERMRRKNGAFGKCKFRKMQEAT